MSHHIENNQLAWKGAQPWHGLGFEVPANATGAEMLKIAGLDWKVQRRALAMRGKDGSGLLADPLKEFRAIVRSDTDQVFQVASNCYQIVQNQEIADFFKEYCEAGHAQIETVGGLNGGSRIWALAKLNGGSDATLGGVDDLRGYLLIATSHDGSLTTVAKATNVRVVCWNTLSAALGLHGDGSKLGKKQQKEFRLRHSSKWTPERAAEAKAVMGIAIEQIQASNELADKLAKVELDEKGRLQFVQQVLKANGSIVDAVVEQSSKSLLDQVLDNHAVSATTEEDLGRVGKAIIESIISSPGSDLPTAKNTLWGAVNGVTHYVDHVRGRSQDTRLTNAWFGAGDKLKGDAVQVAQQIAGLSA